MLKIRKSKDRGFADHGWLKSHHSFSFADYYDEQFMHFRTLRVINEDRIAAGMGFGSHPHKDMEILTIVLEGELQHKDSMGNEGIIKAGDVQKMSAGSGVVHSEFNASKKEEAYLFQIWIMPAQKGIKPTYQQMPLKNFDQTGLQLFASGEGGKGLIKFEQDVSVYFGNLSKDKPVEHKIKSGRGIWLQMIKGQLSANGKGLDAGDAISVEDEPKLQLSSESTAKFLLFDLK